MPSIEQKALKYVSSHIPMDEFVGIAFFDFFSRNEYKFNGVFPYNHDLYGPDDITLHKEYIHIKLSYYNDPGYTKDFYFPIKHFEDIMDYGDDRFDGKIVKSFNDKIHEKKEAEKARIELKRLEQKNKADKERRRAIYENLKKEFEGE